MRTETGASAPNASRKEAETRAERLGELALAGSRRAIEEQVRAPPRRASGTAGGRDDPGGEIAQVTQMLEVAPAQRGAGGFAEEEIADPAHAEPRQREEAANNDRQAQAVLNFDQAQLAKPPTRAEFDPLGFRFQKGMKVDAVGAF
ncbi:MAG: hypothetical protein WAU78_09500 [Roseiarcus sp.]